MASGFFALFDDVASLLDDIATMGKITSKKTAGLLSDDLAVNAEKATGFAAKRELPVIWAITKGSFRNKLIILPIAFLMSAFLPQAITPILILGGTYLAFEGVEKILEFFFPHHKEKPKIEKDISEENILALEKSKIKSAVLTDFILSIEIVILTLGTVADEPLLVQIPVVTFIAFLATVGVYGIVALIVRMDDIGFRLMHRSKNRLMQSLGQALVRALPKVIRILEVVGTIAMLLVGGGIFLHNIHALETKLHALPTLLAELLIGFAVGLVAVPVVKIFKRLFKR